MHDLINLFFIIICVIYAICILGNRKRISNPLNIAAAVLLVFVAGFIIVNEGYLDLQWVKNL